LEKQKEEYPRLPPVKIKSEDKPLTINWSEKFESDGLAAMLASADSSLLIGSYLDVPIGQEIKNAGKVHDIIKLLKYMHMLSNVLVAVSPLLCLICWFAMTIILCAQCNFPLSGLRILI
jgi:hypothetical protein